MLNSAFFDDKSDAQSIARCPLMMIVTDQLLRALKIKSNVSSIDLNREKVVWLYIYFCSCSRHDVVVIVRGFELKGLEFNSSKSTIFYD